MAVAYLPSLLPSLKPFLAPKYPAVLYSLEKSDLAIFNLVGFQSACLAIPAAMTLVR